MNIHKNSLLWNYFRYCVQAIDFDLPSFIILAQTNSVIMIIAKRLLPRFIAPLSITRKVINLANTGSYKIIRTTIPTVYTLGIKHSIVIKHRLLL